MPCCGGVGLSCMPCCGELRFDGFVSPVAGLWMPFQPAAKTSSMPRCSGVAPCCSGVVPCCGGLGLRCMELFNNGVVAAVSCIPVASCCACRCARKLVVGVVTDIDGDNVVSCEFPAKILPLCTGVDCNNDEGAALLGKFAAKIPSELALRLFAAGVDGDDGAGPCCCCCCGCCCVI
jgi:hypothetical protein